MTNRRLDKSLRKSDKRKENKVVYLTGDLGIPLDGQKLVEVPNRQGFVFVRLKGNTSELIQAYNATVSPVYDLPVLVVRSVGIYKVVGRNLERHTNQWTQAPYLPKHGAQHSFNPDLSIGGDIVWTYSRQFMPLLTYPSGSSGSPTLSISPYLIRDLSGNWKYAGNTGTPSFAPYLPITGSRAIMALVYIDTESGNPYLLVNSGTYIDASITGTNQIAPYIPRTTSPTQLPLAAVRLVSGTANLSWNNIYDARPFFQIVPTGTSSGGGAGGGLGIVAWDDGVFKGTGTIVDFGSNLSVSISGSVIRVDATGGSANPPITGSVVIYDDKILKGSALGLSFNDNIRATISGTNAHIDVDSFAVQTDDLTPQVNGTGTYFSLTNPPSAPTTLRLYYNGVRQRYGYHYSVTGSYVYTQFIPSTGSVLVADYDENFNAATVGFGGIAIQDEGILQGTGTILNFIGANVTATVAGNVATISITGSIPWTQVLSESGALLSNFSGTAGNWRSDGTQIMQTGTAASWATAYYTVVQPIAPGYVLEADVRMTSAGAGATRAVGIIIGYNGANNSQGSSIVLQREAGGTRNALFERAFTTIQLTIANSFNDDQYYKLRMVSSGGFLTAYLDGVILGTSGQTPANAADARFIGLSSFGCVASFKNVKGWAMNLP